MASQQDLINALMSRGSGYNFRKLSDQDFGDSSAYRGNPATKMTNTSLGRIRGGPDETLTGINDPRPADPRQSADALMQTMQDNAQVLPQNFQGTPTEMLKQQMYANSGNRWSPMQNTFQPNSQISPQLAQAAAIPVNQGDLTNVMQRYMAGGGR